jgi:uncharacterized protein YjiS (DUF1127 family)
MPLVELTRGSSAASAGEPVVLRLASAFARSIWKAAEFAMTAQERRRQRRALMMLDDRLLKDVGISRLDAEREATKPFWRE